jgi:hypothetical protein
MKNKGVSADVVTLEGKRNIKERKAIEKRDKRNRKMVKRIDKVVKRVEVQMTKMLQVTAKLQSIRGIYLDEKKAV